jgi:rfaE bifunctional protein nucleotidyltransferase chain/domain/rfaE bifunctional protein kinase chain/domain
MTVRLLVVGDTLLDRDVTGRVERVCPDAPVPVVDVAGVRERPGGAGLAAVLAVRPGVEVTLATGIARGPVGDRVRELLRAVELHDVRPGTPTVRKTRVRARGQSLLRLDDSGQVLADGTAALAPEPEVDGRLLHALLGRCDAVLVSDYGGPLTRDPQVRSALAACVADVPVVWDPHPRGDDPVAGVALCTPNRAEAQHFVTAARQRGADLTEAGLDEQAVALQRYWRARAVCVTDGERGAVTAADDGELAVSPAMPCPDGVDTCGAGDRFAAAVALALGRGARPFPAVAEAHADVGRWLTDGGVGALDVGAGRPRLATGHAGRFAVARAAVPTSDVGDATADEVVERVRARGGTVVATGGCFDVLHPGHLALLQRARALGDCLVVLLNSDESVRRLKGPTRPVHTAADRGRLLAGLACVDAVEVFEDDDPTATLARLRPDVWVKGDDYRDRDLPEARTVRALGGRIALVPYLDGHSSTRILQHLGARDRRGPSTPGTTVTTEGGRS